MPFATPNQTLRPIVGNKSTIAAAGTLTTTGPTGASFVYISAVSTAAAPAYIAFTDVPAEFAAGEPTIFLPVNGQPFLFTGNVASMFFQNDTTASVTLGLTYYK